MADSTPPDSWRMPLVDVYAAKRLLLYANAAIWRWELTVDDEGVVSGGLGYPHTTMQTNAEAAQSEVQERVEQCVGVAVRLHWSRMEPSAVASLADERQKRIDEAWTAEVEPEPSEATRLHDEIRSRRNRRDESVRDAFVGQRLEAIQYLGYDRVNGADFWCAGPTHLAEHGMAIRTESGSEFSVVWDSELGHHGLAIVPGLDAGVVTEIHDHGVDPGDEIGVVRADVTGASEWSSVLGVPVADASVLWVAGIPSTIRLTFSNGERIYLTAGEYDADRDSIYLPDDNVTVVFSDADARRLRVPGIGLDFHFLGEAGPVKVVVPGHRGLQVTLNDAVGAIPPRGSNESGLSTYWIDNALQSIQANRGGGSKVHIQGGNESGLDIEGDVVIAYSDYEMFDDERVAADDVIAILEAWRREVLASDGKASEPIPEWGRRNPRPKQRWWKR